MVILLTGTDSYRMHERMVFLREAFTRKFAQQSPRIVMLSGTETTAETLRAHANTTGLFSQKTCIVVLHAEDITLDMREHIERTLRTTPEDVVVLITYTATKKSPWKTLAQSASKVEEFEPLDDGAVRTWLRAAAKKQELTLTATEVEQIVTTTEKNLWDMIHVLHQLKHVVATERSRTLPLLLPTLETSTVFTLLDGISEKNLHKATRALNEQLTQNSSVHGIITLIAKHLGLLYHAAQTPTQPIDAHPFAVKKALVAAKRFSPQHLRALLNELLTIDTQLKSTTVDERALMTIFLIRACA